MKKTDSHLHSPSSGNLLAMKLVLLAAIISICATLSACGASLQHSQFTQSDDTYRMSGTAH